MEIELEVVFVTHYAIRAINIPSGLYPSSFKSENFINYHEYKLWYFHVDYRNNVMEIRGCFKFD